MFGGRLDELSVGYIIITITKPIHIHQFFSMSSTTFLFVVRPEAQNRCSYGRFLEAGTSFVALIWTFFKCANVLPEVW